MGIEGAALTRAQIAWLVGMSDSWVRDRILAGDFPRPGQPAPVYVAAMVAYRRPAGGTSSGNLEKERTRLTAAQAEAVERKNRNLAGETIEMDEAEEVFFETARSARDAWLNWPSRTAPHIASALGVDGDRLRLALEEHVHQQLADLGEPENPFGGESNG